MIPILGTVTFEMGGIRYVLGLNNARQWRVTPKPTDELVKQIIAYNVDEIIAAYAGPSDGFFGPGQLRQIATKLGGTAEILIDPSANTPPGLIY